MKRYTIKSDDKASKKREIETGLYDYLSIAMGIIKNKIPPVFATDNVDDAFTILNFFIAECGNTINIDLPDGFNTDYITGVEIEDQTMRLIWYSVDKAYQGIDSAENKHFAELSQQVFGVNLEQQFGFTFDKLVLTPAYILIYGIQREVPPEIETEKENLKIDAASRCTVYEHHWGEFEHEPVLQYRTRYYCDEGLCAVVYPKAILNAMKPEDFFKT